IIGEHEGIERRAERFRAVAYPTAPGTCAAYFPEANVLVPLDSTADGVERRASRFRTVAYDTPRGCAAAYFPEANVLVPLDSTAEVSGTPTSKSIIVRFEAI
ncbi:MAG TPA: hypothetical protein VGO60_08095, partial [Iamia sp.]|nr:hypothetical protein [Iamia sp.]